MWEPAASLHVTRAQRRQLESWVLLPTAQQRLVRRSQIVLRAADGVSNNAIANELGLTRTTVLRWRDRFASEGLAALQRDRPRGRGKPPLTETKIRGGCRRHPPGTAQGGNPMERANDGERATD